MTESTAITAYEGKRPIVMKSSLVHWVSEETAKKFEDHISRQDAHGFIRIVELGITINTSEIDGVYTVDQYKDLGRIKQGEWQCAWKRWHGKKEVCECEKRAKDEAEREAERKSRAKRDEEQNKPLTPEEKAASQESFTRMNEETVLKGSQFFRSMYAKGNKSGKRIRRSTIERWEKEHGPIPFIGELEIHEDTKEEHEKEIDEAIK